VNKLSGAQIHNRLFEQLHRKTQTSGESPSAPISLLPSIDRRVKVVRPLLKSARLLWVDDNPSNNIYERLVLNSFGISIDLAISTEEALYFAGRVKYDVILSDMRRGSNPRAGTELLRSLKGRHITSPIVFYVGRLSLEPGPVGAFAITDRPDELLHYVFDVLERRSIVSALSLL
jgi:response regulator RpfG family c-di-GMP phosphodiesterase